LKSAKSNFTVFVSFKKVTTVSVSWSKIRIDSRKHWIHPCINLKNCKFNQENKYGDR